ncbi:MAG: trigger factor [Desulfuromonas sp.]|nr:MAG: trigger factor [Desulfuromonas sp.]
MNVSVEELSQIRKKLVIEIAADKVSEMIEDAYKKIAKTASLKGFRKGKIPRALLERHFEPRMQHDVTGALINETLYKALMDEKIDAVSQPQVVDSGALTGGEAFTYQVEVEVKPQVVAKDYTGIALEREAYQLEAASVEKRLEEMAESRAQLEVTSRKKAREGDTVILDFTGYLEGAPFENGAATDYQLELGSGSFIPGFEEQVVGLKREDEKDIELTFPENYGAKELAGKPVVFKVLIKEIKEKVQPKLNDDFAKEFDAETLVELKERVGADILKQESARIDNQVQEQLMNALVERNPMDVPEGMIENQLKNLKQSFSGRLQAQGMTLEMLGMNDEVFAQSYRPMAEQQVKGELILESIGELEKIEVADGDIDKKIEEIAAESNAPLNTVQDYFKKPEMREGLEYQVQHDKILAFLIAKAEVSEVEPKADDAEEKES